MCHIGCHPLSLHDALPISYLLNQEPGLGYCIAADAALLAARETGDPELIGNADTRSEGHTSELQSHSGVVCRLLLDKKNSNSALPLRSGAPVQRARQRANH